MRGKQLGRRQRWGKLRPRREEEHGDGDGLAGWIRRVGEDGRGRHNHFARSRGLDPAWNATVARHLGKSGKIVSKTQHCWPRNIFHR
jgi:hypothetical protein